MHVAATTALAPGEVTERLRACAQGGSAAPAAARALRCELDRRPPKIFLRVPPLTFAPAAELHVDPVGQGSQVVLRLMWGPLPAPFPRAVAAAALVAGLGLLASYSLSPGAVLAAALIAGPAALALWFQRAGERRLRARLAELFGGCDWFARPHP
jgi:hypothetical protein